MPRPPFTLLEGLSIIAGILVVLTAVFFLMTVTPWFVHYGLIVIGLCLFFGGLFNGHQ